MTKRERIQQWVGTQHPEIHAGLASALYAVSEAGLWPDNVDNVSTQQALLCWRIIEQLKDSAFPGELAP